MKNLLRLSIPALLLSAMPALACTIGKVVEIEWNGAMYSGVVLDGPNAQGACFVSYDGWDEANNEWVVTDRLVAVAPVVPTSDAAAVCLVGVPQRIEWNGSIWDGTILEGPNAQGECFVTYSGWDASWNEWVVQGRLLPPE